MATEAYQNYCLTGRITDGQGEPLEGLFVRAYNQDPLTPADPLREEVLTDAEGRYKISFTERDFKTSRLSFRTQGDDVAGVHQALGRSVPIAEILKAHKRERSPYRTVMR
jgi:hypothetical protein